MPPLFSLSSYSILSNKDLMSDEQIVTTASFEALNLHPKILQGIVAAGFTTPSAIQEQAVPIVLTKQDLIAQAQTGTGKTAAFGLPAMSLLLQSAQLEPNTQILVITPTRELAIQVSDELYKLGKYAGIRSVAVYGGQSIQRQVEIINRGCHIVVATPGRLLDHLNSSRLHNFHPQIVVLDEADEMLDMGFLDDIHQIFTFLPKDRQTLLFSATMPPLIKKLAEEILNKPKHIHVAPSQKTNQDIEQRFYIIEDFERQDALIRLIDSENIEKAIVFCSTIRDTDELSLALSARGYRAHALHGNMEQTKRQEAIRYLQSGRINILVATDVAARGLDINGISHVFNYHIPYDPESYVHRIGRTGRAGNKGISATLVSPSELKKLSFIQNHTKVSPIILPIPSRQEVQLEKNNQLLQRVKAEAYDPIENIDDYLAELTRIGMDWEDISRGLVQMIVKQNPVLGPEDIGPSGKKLERIMESISNGGRRSYDRNDSYAPRSRYSNNGGGSRYGSYSRDRESTPREGSSYAPRSDNYRSSSADHGDRAPSGERTHRRHDFKRNDYKKESNKPQRSASGRW